MWHEPGQGIGSAGASKRYFDVLSPSYGTVSGMAEPASTTDGNTDIFDAAKRHLCAYLASMREWEMNCARLAAEFEAGEIDLADMARAAKDAYEPIFQEFCSARRATPRTGLFWGEPPDYDPSEETVEGITLLEPGIVEVHTRQRRKFQNAFVYRLAHEGGVWRLFAKYFVNVDGGLTEANL